MTVRTQKLPGPWLIYIGLALVTLGLYLPAVHHGFVDYDDQQYVTDNPRVQAGLTWNGLIWAFGFHAGNWHPLTWLSHMLDCQLYGARAGGHHLTNVLLHVATTVLLFSVLNRMTHAPWRSAAVAALFGWHPLHVESVAWVAERKDVLCAFFWMFTLLCYVRYAGRPSVARYVFCLVAFSLCLMSKPMGVTLPFVLLLLDYWPLNRVAEFASSQRKNELPVFAQNSWSRVIWEKIPFLILSGIACGLTLCAQELAIVSTAGLPVVQRVAHSLAAYTHYLAATFVPRNLAVYYPYRVELPAAMVVFAAGVLVLVTVVAVTNIRRRPYIMVGWLWYLGTLVPVIGLVQVGDQAWADRYMYLPSIGIFIAVVWLASDVIRTKAVLAVLATAGAAALIFLTSLQLSYWKNTRTLFEHDDKVTPQNYMAVTVLGSLLAKEGRLDDAMVYYQTALAYQPAFPEAHFFLGNALDEQGKLDEAISEYQKALWFRPTQEQTHIFMGMALGKEKRYDEAIAHYDAALKLDPDSAVAENNLARIYHTLGQLDVAVQHYNAALKIDPKLALAHNNLGILLLQKGNLAEGTAQLRDAMRLNPTNAETQLNLAFALNQQQQWAEAADLLAKNVHGNFPDPKAHFEFAKALAHMKKTRAAMSEYATALLIQPDNPDALDGLAWILCTDPNADFRNGPQAVQMAEQACKMTGEQNPMKLKTLGAAYAETGRFGEASNVLKSAQDLAVKANRLDLADECSQILEQVRQSKGWRSQ